MATIQAEVAVCLSTENTGQGDAAQAVPAACHAWGAARGGLCPGLMLRDPGGPGVGGPQDPLPGTVTR